MIPQERKNRLSRFRVSLQEKSQIDISPKSYITSAAAMASSNEFQIRVDGRGAHAALPHLGVDPVFIAVQIAQGLQGIVTRVKKPIDAAVLSRQHLFPPAVLDRR